MKDFQFEVDLDKFAKLMDRSVAVATAYCANVIYKRIILKSPVLTGRFRASWTMNPIVPDETVVERPPPGEVLPPPEKTINPDELEKTPLVYINNSLPYAEAIEDGWSKTKAPDGVVLVTLNELTTFFNDAMKDLQV